MPTRKPSEKTETDDTEDLFFFDPATLFTAYLSCDSVRSQMHRGLGEFVDAPTELWQSSSWLASIRTTSGEFAHYQAARPSPQPRADLPPAASTRGRTAST